MNKKKDYPPPTRRENEYDEPSKDEFRGRRDPRKNKKTDSDRKDRKADNHWN